MKLKTPDLRMDTGPMFIWVFVKIPKKYPNSHRDTSTHRHAWKSRRNETFFITNDKEWRVKRKRTHIIILFYFYSNLNLVVINHKTESIRLDDKTNVIATKKMMLMTMTSFDHLSFCVYFSSWQFSCSSYQKLVGSLVPSFVSFALLSYSQRESLIDKLVYWPVTVAFIAILKRHFNKMMD